MSYVPLMQIAERNRCGQRQIRASELNAPIDDPATFTSSGPAESAWMADTTSSATAFWYWLNSQHRYSSELSRAVIIRPATLSQEKTLIVPCSTKGIR